MNDPRNSLFIEYLRLVSYYKPKFFVLENVLGILTMETKSKERTVSILNRMTYDAGYNLSTQVLDAVNYGVPQYRKRVFFIGIRQDFPFVPMLLHPTTNKQRISVKDALSDLPIIRSGEEATQYTIEPKNDFQRYCRKDNTVLTDHISRKHSRRMLNMFKHIKPGSSACKEGFSTFHTSYMRPYSHKPIQTVTCHFDTNFIHPVLNRTLTLREGARLQSFPDRYQFKLAGGLNTIGQIGNAVPPLLAKAIAKAIVRYFLRIKNPLNFS